MTDNKPPVVVLGKRSNLPPLIEADGKTQRRNRRKQELRKRKGRIK